MEERNLSILDGIDSVCTSLKGGQLEFSAYGADEELSLRMQALGTAMGLRPMAALHFAAVFFLCLDDDSCSLKEIAKYLKISLCEYVILYDELERLSDAGYIQKLDNYSDRVVYAISEEVREAVFTNKIPQPDQMHTDLSGLAELISKCFDKLERSQINSKYAMAYLQRLVSKNAELPVCKWLLEHKFEGPEMLMCLIVFARAVSGFKVHPVSDMVSLATRNGRERMLLRKKFLAGDSPLFRMEIVQWEGDDLQSRELIVLTAKGKDAFFGEEAALLLEEENVKLPANVIRPEALEEKKLFFNERELKEVNRLEGLLLPGAYEDVCARLKEQKMRSGICILFYGSPGTGKTESVFQLAKRTNRSIRQVDISSIKEKWVGESEKRVKAIFDEYRALCKRLPVTPVLLLNEADAVISKRIRVEDSVDQMSNAMQNIFLEEMEKFEGILIATTNLQYNFDPAFDRRFLFKLRFEKPEASIRAQILLERIPSLSTEEAFRLSERFELSGGQIENVARKAVTETVLSGTTPAYDFIEMLFLEEAGYRTPWQLAGKIGF